MKIKIFYAVVLLIVAVFFSAGNALAQVMIEEGKIVLSLTPGQSIMKDLNVYNKSDKTVKVKVYWEDFEYQPPFDGSKKFFTAGTSKYSCSSWVKFAPFELEFPPFGKKKISYVVNTPEDLKGGYYGVLFFENAYSQTEASTGINIVSRVGSLFFLESENKVVKASIDNYSISEHVFKSNLKNEGDVIIIPEGVFYILDANSIVVDRGDIPKVYLPPSETAVYSFGFADNLSFGKYTIVMTVELPEGDVLVREVDFEKSSNSTYNILNIRD